MSGAGEQGLVTTMGRFSHIADPGVALTLPWPVQAVAVRNTAKVEQLSVPDSAGENLLVTRDGQLIDLTFQLRWKVRDLRQFEYQVRDPEAALRTLAAAQMRAAVAELPFDPVWDGSRQGELQTRVLARTQAVADSWRLGVRLEGIDITRANPPARLGPAFSRITEAREEARKAQERAQAWATSALEGARAEADAFDAVYAQYKISPEVTRQRMYYETMERVLANNPKIIAEGGNITLPAPDTAKPPPPRRWRRISSSPAERRAVSSLAGGSHGLPAPLSPPAGGVGPAAVSCSPAVPLPVPHGFLSPLIALLLPPIAGVRPSSQLPFRSMPCTIGNRAHKNSVSPRFFLARGRESTRSMAK